MPKFIVTGVSYSKGTGKESRKEYLMARVYFATKLNAWSNANGACVAAGYQADEKTGVIDFIDSDVLKDKLLSIRYPAMVELTLEPKPDDPLRNIVVDAEVCWTLWDVEQTNKSK